MKRGITLQELAIEIDRQRTAKADYLSRTEHTEVVLLDHQNKKPAKMALAFGDVQVAINEHTHGQIADYTGIPTKYYDRMRADEPELLKTNVGAWFRKWKAERMIRTLDGNARAFLSNAYRPMENIELMEAILPTLQNLGVEIMSAQVTETRLYIKAIDGRIRKHLTSGRKFGDGSHEIVRDVVMPAIVISNSEVGSGALSIEAGVFTEICTNLAIFGQNSMKKYHLGGRQGLGDGVWKMLKADTQRATDVALWKQVRDVTSAAFNEASFAALVQSIEGAANDKIEGDVPKVIKLTCQHFGITESEQTGVLKHLIQGGDLSRYGIHAAITRAAEDHKDYDRATELERIGGKVLEMPSRTFRPMALAA